MIKVISTMALNGIDGIPVVVESSCVCLLYTSRCV